MQSGKSERQRQLTFLVAGGITTVSAAGVFVLVFWLWDNRHAALALDYVWGAAVGYLLNRFLTFGDRTVRTVESLTKYVLSAVLYFVLHWVLMEALVRGLAMNVYLAFALSFFAALVCFYSAQKVWVFRHRPA